MALWGGSASIYLPSTALVEVSLQAGGGGVEYGRNIGSQDERHHQVGQQCLSRRLQRRARRKPLDRQLRQPAGAGGGRAPGRLVSSARGRRPAASRPSTSWSSRPARRDGSDTTFEVTLSGPMVRNRAWFSVSRAELSSNQLDKLLDGSLIDASTQAETTLIKLSGQPERPEQCHRQLPSTLPPIASSCSRKTADRFAANLFNFGGDFASLNWSSTIRSGLFLETRVAQQRSVTSTSLPY